MSVAYTASIALAGTIVGAAIVATTNYALAVRRERADQKRDNRDHAIEVKRAARLIDAELLRAQAAAAICVEKRRWWSADAPQLSTDAWQKHGGTIAPDLSDQAWLAINVAIEAVDNLRTARGMAVDAGLAADAIPDSTAERLAPMLRDVRFGRAALAPLVFESVPTAGNE